MLEITFDSRFKMNFDSLMCYVIFYDVFLNQGLWHLLWAKIMVLELLVNKGWYVNVPHASV